MESLLQTNVGDIVAKNYRTAQVLTAYGIDFCCRGRVTLEEACQSQQLAPEILVSELEEALQLPNAHQDHLLGLPQLIDTIVDEHHAYLRATVPALKAYLEKLVKRHGQQHPELHEIKTLFFEGSEHLLAHLKKEELILFPYIRAMVESQEKNYPLARPHFGEIDNPIRMMEAEHQTEGERFSKIAQLSNHYTPPEDGCQTYQVTFALLQEFEADLHRHIHLENNILFPQAQRLFADFTFK
ncbi:iron-sulfur cluster repair di-iron protein [Tunicatimonas pelagia]|uniref:iron-sulfur cluster repair di-iron protein n=1 Tax=Tunicatimonas pelagia TaxID=931531 RepID=UPI002666D564|nr:iron-sulfur cluster repair di-iron protein [Tunicatimonas pelagia]WKN46423.1 iron-sulfur cluster repair di-iron protein [Tunicatimonas pelagia]